MSKVIYKKSDVMRHLGLSKYKINQLLVDGTLPAPIREKGRLPYWTRRQILICEQRIDAKENPLPKSSPVANSVKVRPLSKKHRAQIRQSAGLPSRVGL